VKQILFFLLRSPGHKSKPEKQFYPSRNIVDTWLLFFPQIAKVRFLVTNADKIVVFYAKSGVPCQILH